MQLKKDNNLFWFSHIPKLSIGFKWKKKRNVEGKGYDLQTISSQTHVTQAMECDFTNGLETNREDSDGEKKVSYGFFFLSFYIFSKIIKYPEKIPEFFQFSKSSLKTPQIPERSWILGEVETLSLMVATFFILQLGSMQHWNYGGNFKVADGGDTTEKSMIPLF